MPCENYFEEHGKVYVREELGSLNIRFHYVEQLQSARSHKAPTKDSVPTKLHCISGARPRGVERMITKRTRGLANVCGVVRGSKRLTTLQASPALWTHAA